MRIRPAFLSLPLLVTLAAPLSAQGFGAGRENAGEAVDDRAVEILRKHGLEHSQVMETLSWICDVYGPRLTGSRNIRRAQDWAVETFTGWGLKNAHLEEWGPFGRGWQLDHFSVTVLGDNPWPVHAYPKAWTPSLQGRVEGEVVAVAELTAEQVEAMDLSDKIVLVQEPREVSEPFDGPATRLDADDLLSLADGRGGRGGGRQRGGRGQRGPGAADINTDFRRQQAVMRLVYEKKPLAILDRSSKGDYGTIFVQGASMPPAAPPADGAARGGRGGFGSRPSPWRTTEGVIPQFTLAVEHYNRLCRLLAKKVPVRLALELQTTFFDDDPMQRNVVAEIPGTGDELVMLGAHFDSWHSGTGATDNGAGSAVMMEAARLLTELIKETGTQPRRTIRVALWSGEEQGLLGSRAYVSEHFAERAGRGEPATVKPEHARLSAYYNLDNGTGRIRGIYLQGNEACAPIFRAWLRPFHDLDASTITAGNTGGTDHQSFDGVGLPGFQFIQDPVAYNTQTHHSNMDNWDHAVAADLQQAATIIASFAWHTAQRDELLPRKEQGEPADAAARGGRRRGGR